MNAPCVISPGSSGFRVAVEDAAHSDLIFRMSVSILDTIDLRDERRVICHLSGVGFHATDIYRHIDEVLLKAAVLRRRDRVLSSISWLFCFSALIAALCVSTLIPTEANAATIASTIDQAPTGWTIAGVLLSWPVGAVLCVGIGAAWGFLRGMKIANDQ